MLVFDVLRATSKGQFKKKFKRSLQIFKNFKNRKKTNFFIIIFISRFGIILQTNKNENFWKAQFKIQILKGRSEFLSIY